MSIEKKHFVQTLVKLIKVTVNQFSSAPYIRTIDTAIKVHTLLANFIEHTKEIKREAFFVPESLCLNKTLFE